MFPFMLNIEKRQIYGDTKWISGCQGVGGGDGKEQSTCRWVWDCFFGVMAMYWNMLVPMVRQYCKYTKKH